MIYAVALSVYTVIFAVAVHPAFLVAFAVVGEFESSQYQG